MRINRKWGFVFVSTPKCGTHTIYKVLDEHYSRGLLKRGMHNNQVPAEHKDLFRWTVCRNPFSRAVSLWWSGCRLHPPDRYGFRRGCGAEDDFTRFVVWLSNTKPDSRRTLMQTQAQWLRPCEPIHAVHMERMDEELRELGFWLPGIKLPQLNTTTEKIKAQSEVEGVPIIRPRWQDMYEDEEAREAVLRWAGEDFERFGYPKEIWDR